ncbi:hypothetical protein SUBVAR_05335 [Subdoligranulum variabile DSM 15176]|uniref:Uncharacterized protein n=1 Tax=Subdoligranulum variabile DSM 15176 TaxID=411471 RepID=D1PLW8_9FIRM|nr:hypothetical protein SUBVAR_05335 [Subdoligranulum variabile DSM 15176]
MFSFIETGILITSIFDWAENVYPFVQKSGRPSRATTARLAHSPFPVSYTIRTFPSPCAALSIPHFGRVSKPKAARRFLLPPLQNKMRYWH